MTGLAAHLTATSWAASEAEPAWLSRVRQQAWENLEADQLPSVRSEDWKYTSLEILAKRQFATRSEMPSRAWLMEQIPDLSGDRQLVFVDGQYAAELSSVAAAGAGLIIGPLSSYLDADGVESEFSSATDEGVAGFTRLATARFTDGVYIEASDHGGTNDAVDLVYICTGDSVCHQRSIIRLGTAARLAVTEHFITTADCSGLSNNHLAIQLSSESKLDWVRVQRQATSAFLVTATQVDQQAGAEFNYFGMDTGGRLVRHDIHSRLLASGASVSLTGITVVAKQQHVDNHTNIEHVAADCKSRERFKSVAGGRSRVVFNGKIKVWEGADGTDSSQSNANLLLSPHAEIDAKPELEIYADDVIAAHGATVGQLDEAAVFYLRSRGLSEEEARQLLIRGFCRELVDRVAQENLHETLDGYLIQALTESGQG